MATTSKDQPAAKKTEAAKPTAAKARKADEPAPTFAADGGALAGDVRAFAEDLRGQLTELGARAANVLAEGAPQDGDEQVAAGCRRIGTAVNALTAQVDALDAAAAQLERDAVR